MSELSQGEGWWRASDGRWYPPEQHPSAGSVVSVSTATVDEGAAPAPVGAPGEGASFDDILERRGRARSVRIVVDNHGAHLHGYRDRFGMGDPSQAAVDEQGLAFERLAQIVTAADQELDALSHLERELATQKGELDSLIAKGRDLRKKAFIAAAVVVALLLVWVFVLL